MARLDPAGTGVLTGAGAEAWVGWGGMTELVRDAALVGGRFSETPLACAPVGSTRASGPPGAATVIAIRIRTKRRTRPGAVFPKGAPFPSGTGHAGAEPKAFASACQAVPNISRHKRKLAVDWQRPVACDTWHKPLNFAGARTARCRRRYWLAPPSSELSSCFTALIGMAKPTPTSPAMVRAGPAFIEVAVGSGFQRR